MMSKRDWAISIISGLLLGGFLATMLISNVSPQPKIVNAANTATSVIEKVLTSHTTWSNVKGVGEIVWYAQNGHTQSYVNEFQVSQPEMMVYVNVSNKNGNGNDGIWISNGKKAFALDKTNKKYKEAKIPALKNGLSKMPAKASEINRGFVVVHPLALSIESPIKEYLFPSWFVQGMGQYQLIGEEVVLGRETFILDYQEAVDGVMTGHQTAWVDKETGIILKYIQYNLDDQWETDIFSEFSFTAIEFDTLVDSNKYSLPNGYSPSETDLP